MYSSWQIESTYPQLNKLKRKITAFRCTRGHYFLFHYQKCPECGGSLAPLSIRSDARLITHTTSFINPSGRPLRLGIAQTIAGAKTLCIVIGRIRGNGRDRVRLIKSKGRYFAVARASRTRRVIKDLQRPAARNGGYGRSL